MEGMQGMHEDIAIEVANEILDSYLRVCNNEFRTYLKTKMQKKNTSELRKMIKQGKDATSRTKTSEEVSSVNAASDTVVDTVAPASSQDTSFVDVVERSLPEPLQQIAEEEVEKSVGTARKTAGGKNRGIGCGKKKGPQKKTKCLKKVFICRPCGLVYPGNRDWIFCDICLNWYCRMCCKLEDEAAWVAATAQEDYNCHSCKNSTSV